MASLRPPPPLTIPPSSSAPLHLLQGYRAPCPSRMGCLGLTWSSDPRAPVRVLAKSRERKRQRVNYPATKTSTFSEPSLHAPPIDWSNQSLSETVSLFCWGKFSSVKILNTGCFFNWYPHKSSKYKKGNLD